MAHQYISFLVIFTLGLGLVVSTAALMSNLSTSIQEESSLLELRLTLQNIRYELQYMIDMATTMNIGSFTRQISLDASLAQRFTYVITIKKSDDGGYFLIGNITGNEKQLNDYLKMNLPSNERFIILSGAFNSIFSIHQVTITVNNTAILVKLHDVRS